MKKGIDNSYTATGPRLSATCWPNRVPTKCMTPNQAWLLAQRQGRSALRRQTQLPSVALYPEPPGPTQSRPQRHCPRRLPTPQNSSSPSHQSHPLPTPHRLPHRSSQFTRQNNPTHRSPPIRPARALSSSRVPQNRNFEICEREITACVSGGFTYSSTFFGETLQLCDVPEA
jgi:hypothetical protein